MKQKGILTCVVFVASIMLFSAISVKADLSFTTTVGVYVWGPTGGNGVVASDWDNGTAAWESAPDQYGQGNITSAANNTITFTATPDQGYYLDHWTTSDGDSNNLTIQINTGPDATAKTVIAYFSSAPTYAITFIADTGGTSSPLGTYFLSEGNVQIIVASASPGYYFQNWYTVGASPGSIGNAGLSTTTFTVGNSNGDVHAAFGVNDPVPTATPNPSGSGGGGGGGGGGGLFTPPPTQQTPIPTQAVTIPEFPGAPSNNFNPIKEIVSRLPPGWAVWGILGGLFFVASVGIVQSGRRKKTVRR